MSLAYLPLYTGDLKRDTGHLKPLEKLAYLELIFHYWDNRGLPTEDERLRRIAGLSARQWAKAKPAVAAFFSSDWRHKRIDRLLAETALKHEKRVVSGAKGALMRMQNATNFGPISQRNQGSASSNATSNALSNAQATKLKERKTVLNSEPRETSSNFTVRRGVGMGFDPSAAIRNKLVEAANGNVSAKAAEEIAPITRLRAQGYSLEEHILPVIAELVPSLPEPLRAWSEPWLLTAILNRRESALGEGTKPIGNGKDEPVKPSGAEVDIRSAPDALDSSPVPDGTVLS